MSDLRAVLWLDHKVAKLFSVDGTIVRRVLATADGEEERRPNKPTASGRRDDHVHERFFASLRPALREVGRVLLCGPGTAKTELVRYLEKHEPALKARIAAVEPMDHPSDPQLLAHAKAFFGPPIA